MRKEILKNGTAIFTGGVHRVNLDGLLLASFISLKTGERFLDLCSGNGIIPLWITDRGFVGEIAAVELQPDASALAKRAAEVNKIPNLRIIEGDINEFRYAVKFDAVSCNPPYYTESSGKAAENPGRAAARTERWVTISETAAAAARNLREGGRFYCCYPPARMESLFEALKGAELNPKRLRFCRHSETAPPWLLLAEARYRGGEGLEVLCDFIAERNGTGTKEYDDITAGGTE